MAESDEEVDVEDISDGEQISHLRDAAGGYFKDSWYDNETGNQSYLHPSNCSFVSDYCDPNSWLLDSSTVWSLDSCTDDKSRAAIEKMILEEQMYSYRSMPSKQDRSSTGIRKGKQSCIGRELSSTHRKPWTTDEQELFEEGLKLYGRSWTKIANMIDTRTSVQVKNYAKQYFRQKNKNPLKSQEEVSQGIDIQCDDSFVLANLEEVTHNRVSTEDGLNNEITAVTLDDSKDNHECESDEDVEVDIDGSDSDEQSNLIPGQTASCPEDVYSALVKAAATAEDLSGSTKKQNGKYSHAHGSLRNVPPENTPAISVHLEECASVTICHDSGTVNQADTEKASYSSYMSPEQNSFEECKSKEKENSTMDNTDKCDIISEVSNEKDDCVVVLSSEFPFRGDTNESDPLAQIVKNGSPIANHVSNSPCCVTRDTCHASSADTFINERTDENISFEPGRTAAERNWSPVSCGGVTCSESIQPCDREHPEASSVNQSISHEEIVIDRNAIQDVEKEHNMEFFMGRTLKTPERYMKIRNYILDMWGKTKPCYLFKTAVRSGLRNCGDVNSIGRVHAFLEDIGAINEGCLDRPVPRVRQQDEVADEKANVQLESWVNSLRPRKKRPRNNNEDWVDLSQPEGMTIEHLFPEERASQEGAPNNRGPTSASRKRPSRSKTSYDPFLLVPCRKFLSPSAVPFDVLIQSETLMVMDAHAHMSTTEVIGLLGGNYSHESRLLKVSKAIPCRSLSTGLQCEMDPVSQTQALEDLAHRGLFVVGWYHSHPTFLPIPSLRDIETQTKFQEWFGKGGAPFIGIIVSPYNYSNSSNQSQIRCLTVSDEWESAGQYRLPYQFDYGVYEDEADEDDSLEQIRSIADDYRTYPFRVQLNRRVECSSDSNLLDKLMDSLRSRLTLPGNERREDFLKRIKETIAENIQPYHPDKTTENSMQGNPRESQGPPCAK
ncbi:deubiquitinase MYSM1-like [Montipora capricornis]|uniref:deubiquitinase MYSM1-like n=1 Tax=Montipora capricornis TaxID=246305 RepID=UPI0035F1C675